jgi:hypothetical protein
MGFIADKQGKSQPVRSGFRTNLYGLFNLARRLMKQPLQPLRLGGAILQIWAETGVR